MHSRIFEVVRVGEGNVPKIASINLTEDSITSSNMPVSDYAADLSQDEVEESISWFAEIEPKLFAEEKENPARCFVITDKIRCSFFKDRYKEFKRKAEDISLEQFSGAAKSRLLLCEMTECLDERDGFYIVADYFGRPVTLDYFVRNAPEARYAIVWAIDYHF